MIIEPMDNIQLSLSLIQSRIRSLNSSGIVNIVNIILTHFQINQCQLTGSNLLQSSSNGYISSSIFVNVIINIIQFQVCANNTLRFGQSSVIVIVDGNETFCCDVCRGLNVVYGLCVDLLNNSKLTNGIYECIFPFEYVDNKCICTYGYLLNDSQCVNIIDSITAIKNLANNVQFQQTEHKIDNIILLLKELDHNIISNTTDVLNNTSVSICNLERSFLANYSEIDYRLQSNTTILDKRIYGNASIIMNSVQQLQNLSDINLFQNSTVLDWRIFNNISLLNDIFADMNSTIVLLNQSFMNSNYLIQQQQNVILNLTQYINCTSQYGYQIINGSCSKIYCQIHGQQSISGICQCANINSIIEDGQCKCPVNSSLIGSSCVCIQQGQIMLNNVCVCSTNGAFLDNNMCTCGINSLNESNTCRCPQQSTLKAGICTCDIINAFIVINKCTCPQFAVQVGNTCVCPLISQIVNNTCSCSISGELIKQGICQCHTSGAFVLNNACSCGLDSLNVSNSCGCPLYSTLVLNACICNQIANQQMIRGSCECPTSYQVANGQCQLSSLTIYNSASEFVCSQQVFVAMFDIKSITHQITGSAGNSGYVFASATDITNALIDISNDIFDAKYPLFQSQSTFNSIRIQIGTQSITEGSLISNNNEIYINQLNIVTKQNCQLTIKNGQFNILQQSSNSTIIQNLMLNVSFRQSNGNITLFNKIYNLINVTNYQILGSYQSYECVTLIAMFTNSATIEINNLNFKPEIFSVGNYSSYLLSYVSLSTIQFNGIALLLGNSSKFSDLISYSSQNQFYQFGGLITFLTQTIVKVKKLILSCYQTYNAQLIQTSGLLIGNSNGITNNINIQNTCIYQVIQSSGNLQQFGTIGNNDGNLSIAQSQIQIHCIIEHFHIFGIVGCQSYQTYSQIIDLITTLTLSNSSSYGSGTVFGHNYAYINNMTNIYVNNSDIKAGGFNGGLTGYLGSSNFSQPQCITSINNVTVHSTNVSSSTIGAGGLIGHAMYSVVTFSNLTISAVRISSLRCYGIVLGYSNGYNRFNFQNSQSIGNNYINDVISSNCASFINVIESETHC
ncbi:Conserved_hypothetical protein [Hexamita inflata]|uniref:Uncharacterized protein n=1 Tax=Hexamita inflata TaxID=28002 RepID=A0AA86UPI5_9EUKA|nr:Conserved hypothetical protein [Hexamita inflata]